MFSKIVFSRYFVEWVCVCAVCARLGETVLVSRSGETRETHTHRSPLTAHRTFIWKSFIVSSCSSSMGFVRFVFMCPFAVPAPVYANCVCQRTQSTFAPTAIFTYASNKHNTCHLLSVSFFFDVDRIRCVALPPQVPIVSCVCREKTMWNVLHKHARKRINSLRVRAWVCTCVPCGWWGR